MKRFRVFRGGPKDGDMEYTPAIGPFPAQVLVVMNPGVTWSPTNPDHHHATFTTGVYLLASVRRQHGGPVATYQWQRQAGHPTPRPEPTPVELQRLMNTIDTHPDLKGRP